MKTCVLLAPSWTPVLAATAISNSDGERDRPMTYAVVVKQATYDDPDWRLVVEALLVKYPSQLFIWSGTLNDVQSDVGDYQPTHVGFVCELSR